MPAERAEPEEFTVYVVSSGCFPADPQKNSSLPSDRSLNKFENIWTIEMHVAFRLPLTGLTARHRGGCWCRRMLPRSLAKTYRHSGSYSCLCSSVAERWEEDHSGVWRVVWLLTQTTPAPPEPNDGGCQRPHAIHVATQLPHNSHT